MTYFTKEETAYMDYLENIYDAPNYGLLFRQGDPIGFEIGMNEWLSNIELEKKYDSST
tara:strand:+ start:305 stop:478 length:174 start_codon:yes stop_codon:yes gene_type:complete